MTKKIFEELPARKHSPATAPVAQEGGNKQSGEGGSEKKIRQAVYDIRYRARREGVDLRAAYAQYMQNSNLSAPEQAAVRAKLFGKDGGASSGGGEKKEVKEAADGSNLPGATPPRPTAAERQGMIKHHEAEKAKDKAKTKPSPKDKGLPPVGTKKPNPYKGSKGSVNMMNSYDATMTDGATGTVASALFKVFVEKVEKEPIQEDEGAERKYKVRVGDPKSGKSYVRYANRSKITELRAKGLKVEMTEHGEPYEGEKKKEGKMDPVAKNPQKRDGDVNNDGKKDGTDKYIYARRDAINAAIAKKNAMKEDFLVDGTTSTEGQGTMVPDGKVNNYSGKNPVVTVNPDSKVDTHGMNKPRGLRLAHNEIEMSASQRRLMEMIAKKNQTSVAEEQGMNCGCGQNPCVTYGEGKEEVCPKCKKCPCECGHADREKRTYRELLKNKLRAMGIKNPMMLGAPDDGETVMKIMSSSTAKMTSEGYGSKKKKKK